MRNNKGQFKLVPIKDRFYSKVSLPNENGCMLWRGAKDSWGYGHLTVNKTTVKAHRLSYILQNGDIPKKMYICHTCDIPACVNPSHLFLGTPKDNMQDCITKKRFPPPLRGELNPASKLNDGVVREIIDLLKYGYTQVEISDIYGVTTQNINYIHHNKSWKHVARDLQPTGNKGDKNGRAKLTTEKVIEIKGLLKMGESTISIANKHGVKRECISAIKCNKNWRHIP